MQKLRSLCCVVLALTISSLALCVGASAEEAAVYSTVTRIDSIVVYSDGGVEYGVAGAIGSYKTFYGPWTGQDSAGDTAGGRFIDTFNVSDPTTGAYIDIEEGSIRVQYNMSSAYPDAESVDVWGTFDGLLRVNVMGVGTYFNVEPKRANLYVNGSLQEGNWQRGDKFELSALVDVGEVIETIEIEYDYYDVFDLAATGGSSDTRRLYFQPGTLDFNENLTEQGLFNGLFEWLRNILNGITSGFSNVVSAITSLPERIAEAIKNLFVPTDAQMDELKAQFNSLLETKLGFVYQSLSLVDGVFTELFNACDNPNYSAKFTIPAFPAFEAGGERVSLWDEPILIDITENQVVNVIHTIASPFLIGIMVWAFVHSMHDAFYAFVGGSTLFEWVRNRKRVKDL